MQRAFRSGCWLAVRGAVLCATGGVLLGPLTLAVVPSGRLSTPGWRGAFGFIGVSALLIGGVIGLASGVVLAVYKLDAHRTNRDRRLTGCFTAAVPFLPMALIGVVAPPLLLVIGALALESGLAGGCLAPFVVRGRRADRSPVDGGSRERS